MGGAAGERHFVGLHVVVPQRPVLEVGRVELPALLGNLDALGQAFGLLLLGDVEHELQDPGAIVGEHLLEGVDLVIALLDHVSGRIAPHLHHQHVLVVRAVEDADVAPRRAHLVHAPEIVLGEFVGVWRLERCHLHADRAAMVEHRAHRAVLAGAVDALQDDEKRPLALGKQPVLQRVDGGGIAHRVGLGGLLVGKAVRSPRVAVRQLEGLSRLHDIPLAECPGFLSHRPLRHKLRILSRASLKSHPEATT